MALEKINNEIYNLYGDRWYTAFDDPVALLRAESKTKVPWIIQKLRRHDLIKPTTQLLDVGCGAGFLSNELAQLGIMITGVDLAEDSLKVAAKFDQTKTVKYLVADAFKLPFRDATFDVLTAMDFLEHVEQPGVVIKEFSRVLRPGGVFIFHTFNRNPLAHFIIIKLVEYLVKNTPKNMHIIRLFIKPSELVTYCALAGMVVDEMTGIKPIFSSIPLHSIFSGVVPHTLKFELTKNLLLSYMGSATKKV